MDPKKLQIKEIGNYEILLHIHPERNSKTFKVKHKFTGEELIMKLVFSDDEETIKKLQRTFKRLALAISKLKTPQLIGFKDFFISEIEGKQCLVLISEFFVGKELNQFISQSKEGSLSYEERLGIFSNVCLAVNAAHNVVYQDDHGIEIEGFPHGDITPWNVLINDDLQIKLLDFKITNRFTLSDQMLDQVGQNSPEKGQTHPISKRADIHQLGSFLFYLFAKDPNGSSRKLQEYSLAEIQMNLDPAKSEKREKKLAKIIYRCNLTNSENRYSKVSDIISDLSNTESNRIKRSRYLKKKYLVAGSAVLVLILISVFFAGQFKSSNNYLSETVDDTRGVIVSTDKAEENSIQKVGDFYALMIANQDYHHLKDLSKPLQDVNTLKNILVNNYGFENENIVQKINASRDDIYDGFEKIVSKVGKNDNLLIFYAGHGQIEGESGYWIPIEGHDKSRRNWISNSEIKKFLKSIVAQNVLVISDACFGGSILRSASSGVNEVNRISNKKTRIALTSGSMESVPDHSTFINQLFWYLENTPDSLVYTSNIFAGIREGIVSNTTNDPGYGPIRDAGHQGGDFFFVKKSESSPSAE